VADRSRPTDLEGWDVKAIASHLAHLESDLCGMPQEPVEVPPAPHVKNPLSSFTEVGVVARRTWEPAAIVDELEQAVTTRAKALEAEPPTDASAVPAITPGGIGWSWETLLSNRVVDMWMHEQDIRRAVGRPGGMTSLGARHTVGVFARALGMVVGKRVAPPVGTTIVLDITGVSPVHLAVKVDDSGRAVPVTGDPGEAGVTLRMDLETYVVLSGGRRRPEEVSVELTGDAALGESVLRAMAVTP
jgi:uncharacterized protein (TIGR03083 family)